MAALTDVTLIVSWEYEVLETLSALTPDVLNDYGARGWELAGLQAVGVVWVVIFKRPKFEQA